MHRFRYIVRYISGNPDRRNRGSGKAPGGNDLIGSGKILAAEGGRNVFCLILVRFVVDQRQNHITLTVNISNFYDRAGNIGNSRSFSEYKKIQDCIYRAPHCEVQRSFTTA